MSEKKTVKVIKKGEAKRPSKPATPVNSAAEAAREMVKTVTNWVNEVQHKRRAETANALKLISKTPRPSEI
ncbi:MAG: hypothetical protein ACR2LM_07035 [Pyrinomonadaceae bacterium]